jgi:hypothetical protein
MQPGEKFTIIYKEMEIEVEWLSISGRSVFKIPGNQKVPLFITRATHENGKKFWTSVPEGNQAEAEAIGRLIEAYYRSHQQ